MIFWETFVSTSFPQAVWELPRGGHGNTAGGEGPCGPETRRSLPSRPETSSGRLDIPPFSYLWNGNDHSHPCGEVLRGSRVVAPGPHSAVRRSRWVRRLLTWPPGRLTCGRISPISVFGPREWFEVVRFPGPGILSRESPPDRRCTPGLGGCVRPLCWVADGRRGSRERSPAVDA